MTIEESVGTAAFARSSSLLRHARSLTPGGVHSNVRLATQPHPLFFDRAAGAHLWDMDGNKYIDFVLGQGPMFLGHSHPAVLEAVTKSISKGQLFAGQHPAEVELATMICEIIPCAERVRFSSSGSEAVHAALRLARAATGRTRIVKFEGHYHGWFDNIFVNVTPSGLPPVGERTTVPESLGQITPGVNEVAVLPWNDTAALAHELAHRDVAAVIMEPIAANQGVILPAPGYLEGVRAECSRAGTALIFDEIITGFRVGLRGAQGLLGITPDIAVFGKAMANGFPISCVAGRAEFFEDVGTGRVSHAGTFNANVCSVSAGVASVRTLRDRPDLYASAKILGQRMMGALKGFSGAGLTVQGLPEIFWTGFRKSPLPTPRDLSETDERRMGRLSARLLEHGIYTTTRGTWFMSTAHSDEDIDRTIAVVGRVVEDIGSLAS